MVLKVEELLFRGMILVWEKFLFCFCFYCEFYSLVRVKMSRKIIVRKRNKFSSIVYNERNQLKEREIECYQINKKERERPKKKETSEEVRRSTRNGHFLKKQNFSKCEAKKKKRKKKRQEEKRQFGKIIYRLDISKQKEELRERKKKSRCLWKYIKRKWQGSVEQNN